jgi:hypothetical protein
MGPEIPKLFGTKTHTIRLQCQMVYQGWANLFLGQLYVVAEEEKDDNDNDNDNAKYTEFNNKKQ